MRRLAFNSDCWEHGLTSGPISGIPIEDPGYPNIARLLQLQEADTFNTHDSQNIYDASRDLYSDLMEEDSFVGNDTLEAFVDSMQASTGGKLHKLTNRLSNIGYIADSLSDSETHLDNLDAWRSKLDSLSNAQKSLSYTSPFEQHDITIAGFVLREEM